MKWVANVKGYDNPDRNKLKQPKRQSRYGEAHHWWNKEGNKNGLLGYIICSYIKMQRLIQITNRSTALNLTSKKKSMKAKRKHKDIFKNKRAKIITPPNGDICRKIETIKSTLGESNKVSKAAEKRLAKAQATIKANERAISICSREIEHHCCICGGIHVFGDHKPCQKQGCSRLMSKMKSLKYLERALEESNRLYNTRKEEYEIKMRQKKEKKAIISSSLLVQLLEPLERGDE